MISQEVSRNLYNDFKDVRVTGIKELVENPILTKEDIAVSKIIGMMLNENVHEVFVQMTGEKSVSCINIRDILTATNIESLKSSNVKRTVPSLTESDNIGNAARIMNLQRLRSLSVINQDNKEVIGQISSKRIIKHIYDTFLGKKINVQKMISASDTMTQGLIVIDPSARFDTAKGTMRKDSIDHLPVAERQPDGKTVVKGMVTSNDIIQTLFPAGTVGRGGSHGITSEQEIIGLADKKI